MKITVEPTLYVDCQLQAPAGFCERCAGELYAPSLVCIRCERDGL